MTSPLVHRKLIQLKRNLLPLTHIFKLTPSNAQLDDAQLDELIMHHDVILDCTDNVAIREQLNRLCLPQKKPLVSGAAIRMEGQLSVFTYEENTPCYHCLSRLFGENNLTCGSRGYVPSRYHWYARSDGNH